jgi:hypothetical protein
VEEIYAAGTLGGKFRRKNTKLTSWTEAKTLAAAWEGAGVWEPDTSPTPLVVPTPEPLPKSGQLTIERAVAAFLAEHAESSAASTQKRYRILMKKFKTYSQAEGLRADRPVGAV